MLHIKVYGFYLRTEQIKKWLLIFKYPSVARATYDSNEGTAKNYIYPIIGDKVIESTKMSKQRKNLRNGLDKPFLRSGFGRGSKIRTHDTWFWRPLLYRLSYTPKCLTIIIKRYIHVNNFL